VFADRVEAGQRLAQSLARFAGDPDAIVLGVPRGGVVVAAEVANRLGLPLDVVIASKIGAPGNPEFAAGAVAADGVVTPNEKAGYTTEDLRDSAERTGQLIRHRLATFRGARSAPNLASRTVIVVDDGIATGLTAQAAIEYLGRQGASKIVLAAPVMPPDSARMLAAVADEVVALEMPRTFHAVGQFYEHFGQTDDSEVVRLLDEARRRMAAQGEDRSGAGDAVGA
jgi:putative phosphoribosyl transferase